MTDYQPMIEFNKTAMERAANAAALVMARSAPDNLDLEDVQIAVMTHIAELLQRALDHVQIPEGLDDDDDDRITWLVSREHLSIFCMMVACDLIPTVTGLIPDDEPSIGDLAAMTMANSDEAWADMSEAVELDEELDAALQAILDDGGA